MVSILSATERNKGCSYSISRQRGIILLLFFVGTGCVDQTYWFPAPEGEPLWRLTKPPLNVRHSAPCGHKMSQQAAPGNYPGATQLYDRVYTNRRSLVNASL